MGGEWVVDDWVVNQLGGRAGAGRSSMGRGCSSISTAEVCCAFLQICDSVLLLKKFHRQDR